MSRYDGLIIPRSYNEYINKSDPLTLAQALQQNNVLSAAVAAGDNKAVKSDAVNAALADLTKLMVTRAFELTESTVTFNINNLWAKLPNNTFVSTFYYMCDGGQRTGVYTKYSNNYGWIMVGFRNSFDIYTVNNNVITKKL